MLCQSAAAAVSVAVGPGNTWLAWLSDDMLSSPSSRVSARRQELHGLVPAPHRHPGRQGLERAHERHAREFLSTSPRPRVDVDGPHRGPGPTPRRMAANVRDERLRQLDQFICLLLAADRGNIAEDTCCLDPSRDYFL
jgi:hypothetical protein